MVRRPSVVVRRRRRLQCTKIFFSETALPIKAKFNLEPPWVGGTIFCSRHLGHMTKMAVTPIYGKKPSKPPETTEENTDNIVLSIANDIDSDIQLHHIDKLTCEYTLFPDCFDMQSILIFLSSVFFFLCFWGDLGKRVWSHRCFNSALLPSVVVGMTSYVLFLILLSTVT